jgi:hypothetical protein
MPRGIPKNKTAAAPAADAAPKRRGRPPKNPDAIAAAATKAEPKKRGPYKKKGVTADSMSGGKSGGPKLKGTGSSPALDALLRPNVEDVITRIKTIRDNIALLASIDNDSAKEALLPQIHALSVLTDSLYQRAPVPSITVEDAGDETEQAPAPVHTATATPVVAAPPVFPTPPSFAAPPPFPPVG